MSLYAQNYDCSYEGWPSKSIITSSGKRICDKPHRHNPSYKKVAKTCDDTELACPVTFGVDGCITISSEVELRHPIFYCDSISNKELKSQAVENIRNLDIHKKAFEEMTSMKKGHCIANSAVDRKKCKIVATSVWMVKKGLKSPPLVLAKKEKLEVKPLKNQEQKFNEVDTQRKIASVEEPKTEVPSEKRGFDCYYMGWPSKMVTINEGQKVLCDRPHRHNVNYRKLAKNCKSSELLCPITMGVNHCVSIATKEDRLVAHSKCLGNSTLQKRQEAVNRIKSEPEYKKAFNELKSVKDPRCSWGSPGRKRRCKAIKRSISEFDNAIKGEKPIAILGKPKGQEKPAQKPAKAIEKLEKVSREDKESDSVPPPIESNQTVEKSNADLEPTKEPASTESKKQIELTEGEFDPEKEQEGEQSDSFDSSNEDDVGDDTINDTSIDSKFRGTEVTISPTKDMQF